jgi:2-dehydropantoate 2-reductase
MRFVVLGAGAVGGVVGGRLAESGHDVTLIARGAHLEEIRRRGLVVRSPAGDRTLPLAAEADPEAARVGAGDVVLLAVKSQDTHGALQMLAAACPATVPVVCLQNGVANERAALRRFANVYAVPVMLPSFHLEPGVVAAKSAPTTGILDVGRYPRGIDDTARQVAAAFSGATFSAEARADVMRMKYSKLVMNLANAVQALFGEQEGAEVIIGRARREGRACLTAAGVDVASPEEDRARRGDHITVRPVDGEAGRGGSTWQSLARAAGSVEVDHLNGEIVLLGRLHGVATPVNAELQRWANDAARRLQPPGVADLDEFLARVAEPSRS